ncbi:MAG: M28 family peptidase [Gammaproteobacteria bacterium]|nr:M28 family peptidase [Gammaproteobacteria bacterium]MDH5650434.1 M28 family peptidase [Gammaproteobacteria bacterium]
MLKLSSTSGNSKAKQRTALADLFALVDTDYYKSLLHQIAIPRHYVAEPDNNRKIADWLETEFTSYGLKTRRQGQYDNIIASRLDDPTQARVCIGAHYDSVPGCPGADDNGSAVAGMLGAARLLSQCGDLPVVYVAFNREEDGFLGSLDFVQNYLAPADHKLEVAHILEMIGYCDTRPGTQSVPDGLPLDLGECGDFLGVICNDTSNHFADGLIQIAEQDCPQLPVKTLQVYQGLEHHVTHLLRSDHSAFWRSGLPATMWTDTSEFRNSNYHQAGDTPDTLDYEYLQKVTELLVCHTMAVVDYRL